ncbi:hypothetical protein BFJ66_g16604 [Fusarium oxysporum f. sp. cepae]|uniref:Uncharacterized protein n=1 Tax=Fusarium oxysporum f. sp. cepae TaxID=396571 RepID=A0A3L6N2T4_FUSOX|nr:hypothetical protein BFJ65_g13158 [Fusarium oxysporum f. sp. cepae]RKK27554.1 hypothetical protein BFJ66_g16604 [Fusarium oxysporum f. sp. cepae]
MDGIREFAQSSSMGRKILNPIRDSFDVIHISQTSGRFEYEEADRRQADLLTFFREGLIEENVHNLKIVCVPMDSPDSIVINEGVFGEILEEIRLDPWIRHLIRTRAYGYYHSGRMTCNGVATYYLGTSFVFTIWTTRQEQSGFATKCLILVPPGDSMAFRKLKNLRRSFRLFRNDSHSTLYLPFVFSVDAITWRERCLMKSLDTIREVESKTGHGSWGPSYLNGGRDDITVLTASLGSALNTIGNTIKHLNIIESVWTHLEKLPDEMQDAERNEFLVNNNSILSAINILRQQSSNAGVQAQYLELRIRSQTSVVSRIVSYPHGFVLE